MWLFATHMKTWVTFFFTSFCVNIMLHTNMDYVIYSIRRFLWCLWSESVVSVVKHQGRDKQWWLEWCVLHTIMMSKTQVKMNFVNPKKFAGPCVREGSLLNDIDGRILLQWVRFWSFKAYCAKLSFMYETISRHFHFSPVVLISTWEMSGDPRQIRHGIVTMSARRFQSHAFVKRVAALKLWPVKGFPTWLHWSLETHIFGGSQEGIVKVGW